MLLALHIARPSCSGRFIISVMISMIPLSGVAPGPPERAFPHMVVSGPHNNRVEECSVTLMPFRCGSRLTEVRGWPKSHSYAAVGSGKTLASNKRVFIQGFTEEDEPLLLQN